MHITFQQINAYKKQKLESIIQGSKCFFVIQLYNLTTAEIDTLKEKTELMGLKLLRFPLINLHQTSTLQLQTVDHLPVQISNYILLGKQKFSLNELNTLHKTVQEHNAILIFGYQENIWFNRKRLSEDFELHMDSAVQVHDALKSYFELCTLIPIIPQLFYQLFSNFEFLSNKLK